MLSEFIQSDSWKELVAEFPKVITNNAWILTQRIALQVRRITQRKGQPLHNKAFYAMLEAVAFPGP